MMDQIRSELVNAVHMGIPRYSLSGLTVRGMVFSVYDGDTCDMMLLLPGEGVKRFVVRMLSYNSPEIKVSKLLKYEEREKCHKEALEAKCMLAELLGLKEPLYSRPIMRVECQGWDKYGRLLARIYDDSVCINELMLLNGYGVSYEM